MEENDRSPLEDISYIRRILERAADDMKTAAPWFTGFGILWLVYGLLSTALRFVTETVSASAAGLASVAGSVLGWLFYIVLAAGFVVYRRRKGLEGLARKLVDMWGVCITVFIALSLCLLIAVPGAAVRLIGFGPDKADGLSRACAVGMSVLFFVLPMLPLLITSVFLERRRMLWVCAAAALFAAAMMSVQAVLMFRNGYAVGRLWGLGWTAAAGLLDIIPGVLLLIFGRSLKRG